MNEQPSPRHTSVIGAIVDKFLDSQKPILLTIFALAVGITAVFITPREEDPQIVVPLADIFVQFPGASAEEVEQLVATPLEQLLWQINGVEYVYSTSRRDMAVVTVRFYVGEDMVDSLVRLHNKISMNYDQVPAGVKGWVIKPVSIDDVPIINLTFSSTRYNDHELRRIGEEVLSRLEGVEDISRAEIVGGRKREVRVEIDPHRLAGFSLSPLEVQRALAGADVSLSAGSFKQGNRAVNVTANSFISSAREVENLVVGVHQDRPVHVRDIARVIDGPEEPSSYSRIGFSSRYVQENDDLHTTASRPAVTLALAKKKGTNAVVVADNVLAQLERLKREVIPDEVRVTVTRNYGDTAKQKVDDLLSSLIFAILTVIGLIAFTMGWKEGLIVAVAVPVTFCMSLFVNYLTGYTINRVTLFALILSLGLVVDDPITNVDNIQRHILLRQRKPRDATLFAVNEVLPPVIMSTLAIIVSFLPLFFITGMMGPYMAPMAANVPLTVTFSTVNALAIVPWLSLTLLQKLGETSPGGNQVNKDATPPWIKRTYRTIITPFLTSRPKRWLLLLIIVVLLGFSLSLVLFRQVPLKMLPFDNKSEFQIVIDMDEGTPLEQTDRVMRAFEHYLTHVPEVTSFVTYAGTASPMDFNGLVRHYYMRQSGNVGDIRVNLADKERRKQQSHEIVLRLRRDLEAIADTYGARIKLVEMPPGPPVIATIVAEIYGTPANSYQDLITGAERTREVFRQEPFVSDIDDTVEADRERINFIIDKEKCALHGIAPETILTTLNLALDGVSPASVHLPDERHQLRIKLILPRMQRSSITDLGKLGLKTAQGRVVELAELGTFIHEEEDQPIYHKNLDRVVYLFGEPVGRAPAEAILDMQNKMKETPLPEGVSVDWAGEGEWHITLKVFRDLGIAFGAALIGIYLLLIIQTGSYLIPVVIMTAIPLTLIGIMPGFWFLNLFFTAPIEGFGNPVFFTATSMIGMIALGGIVVRNSIVLIEFIDDALAGGLSFIEAIQESGAVRMRPILLTAATTALGAWPITLDPIFSGLAWALIFGLFASTAFTLVVVPVVYFSLYRKKFDQQVRT